MAEIQPLIGNCDVQAVSHRFDKFLELWCLIFESFGTIRRLMDSVELLVEEEQR